MLPVLTVLETYGISVYRKTKQIAIHMHLADKNTSAKKAHESLIAWILETNRTLGIPTKRDGMWEEDIPELARHADEEANPLYPVPVLMDALALEKLYYKIKL